MGRVAPDRAARDQPHRLGQQARARAGAARRGPPPGRSRRGSRSRAWRMIGPVSTPSSTRWTVTPKTFTAVLDAPARSRARPGNAGSSDGMDVDDAVGEAAQERRREQLPCSRPARRARRRAPRASRRSRRRALARSAWSAAANTRGRHARARGARSSAGASGLSEATATTSASAAVDRVEQRLEVRARARREHADPQRRAHAAAATSFGYAPPVETQPPRRRSARRPAEHLVGASGARTSP